jgi:hypothetical protein
MIFGIKILSFDLLKEGNDYFEWIDNSAFRYSKWAPGKPDSSYLTTVSFFLNHQNII